METKSEESLLFIDEAVLAYVHILEVLSEEYKSSHNTKVDLEKAVLLNELSAFFKQDQANSTQKINKLINKIAGLKLSLKVKIFHMLDELGLRNPKSEAIIERFIDHRNSIAHGRKDIYQDQLVFPLKPFFSFIKDVDEDIKAIKILSAQVISKHFNLTSWQLEWDELMVNELVPIEQVKIFLKEKKYEAISLKDFFNGKIEDIFPLVFSHYYLRKKLDFEELENAFSPFLNFRKATKNICEHLFDVAVVLADSTKPQIAQKSKDIVKATDANRWGYYNNVRDIIKRHEYFGVKLVWFESWLDERANRL